MNSTTLPQVEVRPTTVSRPNPTRFLYPAIATVLFALVLLGFRQFYLHGRAVNGQDIPAPVRNLLIVHGVAMTTWIVLFVVQSWLIAANDRRLHISLGLAGAVLAAGIVVLGVSTAVLTTQKMPGDLVRYGLHRKQFVIVPLTDMLNFALMVTIGVWNRRNPKIHRPAMLLATVGMMAAATNRIPQLRNLLASNLVGHLFGPYLVPLTIGVLFFAVKTALTRSFDRWLAAGLATLAVIWIIVMQVAPTAAWERFVNYFIL